MTEATRFQQASSIEGLVGGRGPRFMPHPQRVIFLLALFVALRVSGCPKKHGIACAP